MHIFYFYLYATCASGIKSSVSEKNGKKLAKLLLAEGKVSTSSLCSCNTFCFSPETSSRKEQLLLLLLQIIRKFILKAELLVRSGQGSGQVELHMKLKFISS